MTSTDQQVPVPTGGRMRWPLAIALCVVVALLVAYWLYVRQQTAYFVGRDLRVLSTFGDQLDGAFDGLDGFLRNFAWHAATPDEQPQDVAFADLLPGFVNGVAASPPPPAVMSLPGVDDRGAAQGIVERLPAKEFVQHEWIVSGGERWVRIWYAGVQVNPTAAYAAAAAAESPDQLQPDPHNMLTWEGRNLADVVVSPEFRTARGDVLFSAAVEPLVHQSFLAAFDVILLADATTGDVFYAKRPNDRTSLTAANFGLTNLGTLEERVGWRDYSRLTIESLRDQVRLSDVSVAGEPYMLFTRPFLFPATDAGTLPAKAAPPKPPQDAAAGATALPVDTGATIVPSPPAKRWIICGLVSQHRFKVESRAISATRVALIVAVLLLAICWWPFLRIWLSDEHQALTITDAISVAFSAVIATAILTLVAIDAVAYRQLSWHADDQLRSFAAAMDRDFSSTMVRAARALKAIDEWGQERTWNDWAEYKVGDKPEEYHLLTNARPEIAAFPYFSKVAWLDAKGFQLYKIAMKGVSARVPVGARSYFQDALAGRMLFVPETHCPDRARRCGSAVTLESIRSSTTGEPETVMAMRNEVNGVRSTNLPVVAMTFDLIDVMHSVPPAGVQFAIVDGAGNVIFHSDAERNREERFFAETDDLRALRSAVTARREAQVAGRYWGEDQSFYVRPLSGTSWSLVTFRRKALLRAVNIETLVITILLLLLGAAIYLLIFVLIVLRTPRYRAPSLWPDRKRAEDYAHLIVMYALGAAVMASSSYAMTPRSLLPILFVAPAQLVLSTYLLLHNHRRSWVYAVTAVAWIATTVLYLRYIVIGDVARYLAISEAPRMLKALIIVLLAFEVSTALGFFAGREPRVAKLLAKAIRYPRSYRVSGVMLLIVAAALPTIGFFKVALWLEMETLVKFSQRDFARKLEQRIAAVAEQSFVGIESFRDARPELNRLDDPAALLQNDALARGAGHAFRTSYRFVAGDAALHEGCGEALRLPIVSDRLAAIFPQYSEDSVGMRDLYGSEASDQSWRSCGAGRILTMETRMQLPPAALQIVAPGAPPNAMQRLLITSEVPFLFPTWLSPINLRKLSVPKLMPFKPPEEQLLSDMTATLLYLILLVAFLLLLLWMVDFIATRVFLLDIVDPLWLRGPPLSPTLGEHILLIRSTSTIEELTASTEFVPFFDIEFQELAANGTWLATLLTLERTAGHRSVRIRDFEYGLEDRMIAEEKLRFLERLLILPDRPVIIVSRVRPALLLAVVDGLPAPKPARAIELPDDTPPSAAVAPAPPPAMRARWEKVLAAFVWVTEEQLNLRREQTDAQREADADAQARPSLQKRLRELWGEEWKEFRAEVAWLRDEIRKSFGKAAVWKTRLDAIRDYHGKRWNELTNLFTVVPHDEKSWLAEETRHDSFLQSLLKELEKTPSDRRELSVGQRCRELQDEILERARSHYAALWQSCSPQEKLLIFELAQHGLINGKDRRTVRRLIARGLVRREGNLKLVSETFRLHVLSEGRHENVAALEAELSSRWNEIRLPLFIVFITVAMLVFGTQKDLKEVTTAVVTGLTTGIPLIVKLLGVFTERRLQTPQQPT